jgi:hypothetical protein
VGLEDRSGVGQNVHAVRAQARRRNLTHRRLHVRLAGGASARERSLHRRRRAALAPG